jgi:hypothetical protein
MLGDAVSSAEQASPMAARQAIQRALLTGAAEHRAFSRRRLSRGMTIVNVAGELAKGCPVFDEGGSIDVYETIEVNM